MRGYSFTKLVVATFICLLAARTIAQVKDPHIAGNVPLDFYGRIIDQNGQPVQAADIQLRIKVGYLTNVTSGKEQWDPYLLKTDLDGRFCLTNKVGGFLQFVEIEKEGYKLLPQQVKAGFMYFPRRFYANSNDPVVFKMWKLHGLEPLVNSSWRGNIVCDGHLETFDLATGKPSTVGGLEIRCTRVPLDLIPREHKPYDYELKITVVGAGIQATDDEFTYLAPDGGYQPDLTLGAKAGDPKWVGNVKQEFYIKTAEGHYGTLFVDWYAELTSPTHLDWQCAINSSGSRNLER